MDINFARILLFIVVTVTILTFIHLAFDLKQFLKDRFYKGAALIIVILVFLGLVFSLVLYKLIPLCGF